MMKWGLPFGLGEATPFLAFLITLCMTLAFGWLIGNIVVRSGLSSFIVTLAFWFFLRGLTEVCFRLINQNTNVSGLPDFKKESWFAEQMGGEVFGWLFDAWYWIGTKVSAGAEFTAEMTKSEKLDMINYLSFLNINRKMEQWVTGFDARYCGSSLSRALRGMFWRAHNWAAGFTQQAITRKARAQMVCL